MDGSGFDQVQYETLVTADLGPKGRYELLTSLIVPRPIGWISTRSRDGVPNLAPFSYFSALAASPMLLGVSIGHRSDGPKDSLANALNAEAFCVNIVTESQLEPMNITAGEFPEEVDEFERAKLDLSEGTAVTAPFVTRCPAVMECKLWREVPLDPAPNTLLIGEVMAVRLSSRLRRVPGALAIDPESLRPVARLGGPHYSTLDGITTLHRPG